MKVVWFDSEVHNPVLRFLVALLVGVWVSAGVLLMIVFVAAAVLTFPIWVLIDIVLKRYGRRGFVIHNPDNTIALSFTLGAFRP